MKIKITKEFDIHYKITPNTKRIIQTFGITPTKRHTIFKNFEFSFDYGDIIYITGFSGSGKSILLKHIYSKLGGEYIYNWQQMKFEDKPLIDFFEEVDYKDKIYFLSKFGLGEVWKWVSSFNMLSDGEKYRFILYHTFMKLLNKKQEEKIIYIDEYCSTLDRLTAKAISNNLHKNIKKYGYTLFIATTHEDLIPYLKPDLVIRKEFDKNVEVRKAAGE